LLKPCPSINSKDMCDPMTRCTHIPPDVQQCHRRPVSNAQEQTIMRRSMSTWRIHFKTSLHNSLSLQRNLLSPETNRCFILQIPSLASHALPFPLDLQLHQGNTHPHH
jgi:hypothetical protein